jgi:hypothetical protein
MTGPPHRYHTKVSWNAAADKQRPGADTSIIQRVDVRYEHIAEPHMVLGYILVRGWGASAFVRGVSEQEILTYLSKMCQKLEIEGVRVIYRGKGVNWGFLEGTPVQEADMHLIDFTEPADRDPGGLGAYGEFLLVGEVIDFGRR